MSKRQDYLPLINKDHDFVSPNRRTYYQLLKGGLKTERVGSPPVKREEPKVMNGRTKAERKALAKQHGSTGSNLKKKHLNRKRKHEEYIMLLNEGHKFEIKEVMDMGYTLEQAKAITEKE